MTILNFFQSQIRKRYTIICGVFILLFGSCRNDSPDPEPANSGTRLKQTVWIDITGDTLDDNTYYFYDDLNRVSVIENYNVGHQLWYRISFHYNQQDTLPYSFDSYQPDYPLTFSNYLTYDANGKIIKDSMAESLYNEPAIPWLNWWTEELGNSQIMVHFQFDGDPEQLIRHTVNYDNLGNLTYDLLETKDDYGNWQEAVTWTNSFDYSHTFHNTFLDFQVYDYFLLDSYNLRTCGPKFVNLPSNFVMTLAQNPYASFQYVNSFNSNGRPTQQAVSYPGGPVTYYMKYIYE